MPVESVTEQEFYDRLDECLAMYATDPRGMLELGRQLLDESESLGIVWLRTTALMACGSAAYYLGLHEEFMGYYEEAEKLQHLVEHPVERGKLLNEFARVRISHGDHTKALEFLIEARSILEKANDTTSLSQSFDLIGLVLHELGDYEQALQYLLRGLDLRTEHDVFWGRINSLCNIGGLYGDLKEPERALEYFKISLEECRKAEWEEGISNSLGLIGNSYILMGKYEEALTYLLEAWRRWMPGEVRGSYTLSNIGTAYKHLGQYDVALEYYEKGLEVAEHGRLPLMRAFIRGCLAHIHRIQGDPDRALGLLLEGLRIAEETELPVEQSELHEQLADLYSEMGRLSDSLAHYKAYMKLRETIVSADRTRAVIAVELRHSLSNAERERELLRLRAEQANREMEYNVKELNAVALQLTQRNEALKVLHEMALPHSRQGRGRTKELAARIIENIESVSGAQEGWALFEGVYREFIGKLREIGPKLTPTETRICVLIKMNLSTKQIADFLFTSVSAVKMHRMHVRRKLGLESDDNLGSLFLSM